MAGQTVHVLALVTDAFGGHGGIACYNRDILSALAAADSVDGISILPRLAASPLEKLPKKVNQLPAASRPLAYSGAALRLAMRIPQVSIIFCGHILMAPLAALLSRVTGAPIWLQVHGIDAWHTPSRHIRWAAEQAAVVTSVSRYTREKMIVNWWGGDPNRIHVLPNTLGGEFSPGPKPAVLVERYGLRGRKVLLTVSRIAAAEKYKGHDRVIKALPKIVSRHPETLYLIVGDGDDASRLRALVESMRLGHQVGFAGPVSGPELLDHYRAADVFIMPSTGEGFGIVFLEAAASGLHVIGGGMDGSLDALREGVIGEAIDPIDIDEITAAVCRAFEAPGRPDPNRVAAFSFDNFKQHAIAIADEILTQRHDQHHLGRGIT